MADFSAYQHMEFELTALLSELAGTWPTHDIEYVRDIVSHAEYGEALENLVALGATNAGFSAAQMARISKLATSIGIDPQELVPARSASAA